MTRCTRAAPPSPIASAPHPLPLYHLPSASCLLEAAPSKRRLHSFPAPPPGLLITPRVLSICQDVGGSERLLSPPVSAPTICETGRIGSKAKAVRCCRDAAGGASALAAIALRLPPNPWHESLRCRCRKLTMPSEPSALKAPPLTEPPETFQHTAAGPE